MSALVSSPLRYPGGKACLVELVTAILRKNGLYRCEYMEPYAGGCGLALTLLFSGAVSDIHINDIDSGIWSLWHSILNKTEEFVELINATPVTITEWHRQRSIYSVVDMFCPLELGFATFFLNRTNRSGVIKGAGVIGGLDQKGSYKLDCRFNKEELVRRIRRIANYRDRIHLTNLDALKFMELRDAENVGDRFLCIDPPYFNKGSSLYTSFYGANEHQAVADTISKLKTPWIVTYDNTAEIHSLYADWQRFIFNLNYSVQTKRIGSEVLIASSAIQIPRRLRVSGKAEETVPQLRLQPAYEGILFS